MKLREETRNVQEALGLYCREGGELNLPGLTSDRAKHYRRLVRNVVYDSLAGAFPITVAALDPPHWEEMVDAFFRNGNPQTPSIWKLPLEFYQFHLENGTGARLALPWLDDLLLFEWTEIEVHTMPDLKAASHVSQGDLLHDTLVFNPEKRLLNLEYPVHLYPAQEAADDKGSWFSMLYRMPETGHVRFLDLSPLHVHLLTEVEERAVPVIELKAEVARITGIESEAYLDESLERLMGGLMEKRLILGFKVI